jgi:hypothetical protein
MLTSLSLGPARSTGALPARGNDRDDRRAILWRGLLDWSRPLSGSGWAWGAPLSRTQHTISDFVESEAADAQRQP